MMTLTRKELAEILPVMSTFIPATPIIPILNVLWFKDGWVSGTNLDQSFRRSIGCLNGADEAHGVPLKVLRDVVKFGKADTVSFDKKGKWLYIESGDVLARVEPSDIEQMPEIFLSNHKAGVYGPIDFKTLLDAYRFAGFAISHEQSRFTLAGGQTLFSDGFGLQTTDGHRAVTFHAPGKSLEKPPLLIPAEAMKTLSKLRTPSVNLSVVGNRIRFDANKWEFETVKLSGTFPNLDLIKRDWPHSVVFEPKSLLAGLQFVLTVKTRTAGVVVNTGAGRARLRSFFESADDPALRTFCDVLASDGPDCEFSVNGKYVVDFLKATECKYPVRMHFTGDPHNQVRFTLDDPAETFPYQLEYIVMPLRGGGAVEM